MPRTLLHAYSIGMFPWFDPSEPILWWCPDPRCLIRPTDVKISKTMRQAFRRSGYRVTADTAFSEVLKNCAGIKRKDGEGTWLSDDMYNAYCNLFELGYAHSIEVWDGEELIGGLYGTCIGSAFFDESMYSKRSNTSKMALISLDHLFIEKHYRFIDCQIHNDHLESMGATLVSREDFLNELEIAITESLIHVSWKEDFTEFIHSVSFTQLYK